MFSQLFTKFPQSVDKKSSVNPSLAKPKKLSQLLDLEVGKLPQLSDCGFFQIGENE